MRCCCLGRDSSTAVLIASSIGASVWMFSAVDSKKKARVETTAAVASAQPDVLGFTMKRLNGSEESLAAYKGKVILIVNTASKCGLTPQYKGLETLYEAKKDAGFVILGFPANNFMGQEPGTDAEISEFCAKNYGVTFPMFSKISVKGADQHPLYQALTGLPEPLGGEVRWNFDKFLVDKSGKVVARFSPKTAPDDKDLVAKIDELVKN